MSFPAPPLGPRSWLAWPLLGLAWLLARLPWPLQQACGRALGALLHALLPGRRRVALRNVALCFPQLDEPARRALVRANFRELGIGLFEFARAWWGTLGEFEEHSTFAGLEHLRGIDGPVIFAANHQSHLDTLAILDVLPPRWRYRVAPAMAKEFFKAHFFPDQYSWRQWLTNSINYYMAALYFNAFPLPQREAGTRQTLRYFGTLVTAGFSVLIFPEGTRTASGTTAMPWSR